MATLDDKILGEKVHYYCSSSEGSDDENKPDGDSSEQARAEKKSGRGPEFIPEDQLSTKSVGSCYNTGPKGVIKDWQRYKQLETEKRAEQEAEKLDLMKKLSMTCRSHLDDEKKKNKNEEELEKELVELEDEFMKQYMKRRMEEMMAKMNKTPKFGKVISIKNGDEFLEAVDKEAKDVTVIVHIYEDDVDACEAMNGCLQCLASQYPATKFCRVKASNAGVSRYFSNKGVPALLVYKGGQLVGNFVQLTKEFGEDFFASDVENFLQEHGMLPDGSLVPAIIRCKQVKNEDSDFELD